jgi:hypothetical protein
MLNTGVLHVVPRSTPPPLWERDQWERERLREGGERSRAGERAESHEAEVPHEVEAFLSGDEVS